MSVGDTCFSSGASLRVDMFFCNQFLLSFSTIFIYL